MFELEKKIKEIDRVVEQTHYAILDMRSELQESFYKCNGENIKKLEILVKSLREDADMLECIINRSKILKEVII